jgi:putative membrane protein
VEYADRARGKQVITEGMVAWDKTNKNRFYLFRFVVVCCVADAQPIAVLVECDETERPKQNIWVKVVGIADIIKVDGDTGVIIRKASTTSIRVPKEPYLY